MNDRVIIPDGSPLRQLFDGLAARQRIVFFAGIPGVGKSLLVQQLAILGQGAGRQVHLLQWDVTRAAFETPEILRRYPETDGVTHLAIRTGVGLWAREAVLGWHERHTGSEHMLVGEVTLVGNRLIELAEPHADRAEPLLSSADTLFLVPVPSRSVRKTIEAARERTIANPQHGREAADAAPNVLHSLWRDLYLLAHELGLSHHPCQEPLAYDPDVYATVYQHLLRERRAWIERIDTRFPRAGSVYDLAGIASELAATPEEVERMMRKVEERFRQAPKGGATSSQV